ncbi:LEM-3-like GIY-YIG domain-containing protein [Agrobacterium rosae]|uniref:LEM-3-like GIY-YIG domain-containing protein n=1 Tax=Agrobacterium rosae TaxID=1972867 RepID=UPI00122F4594|nr:hypothetical protein [Agrobacterium rosae]KAA3506458.1 hypothetical protein DXM21_25020 [Agrobacterium rosae]KAA3511405.1 hypothetical protein DXM25_25110 [Agrobacterium rosae]MQB51371.1 hypothetical protein [Agrobacterium rosae]
MSKTNCFPSEVCEKLGNYVYRLIDPRNGETFYVGKGRNNRVFDHAAGLPEISTDASQQLGAKLDRIRAIKNAGLNVLHVIHRHEIPDEAIFEVEASLIDAYPGLTNIQGGHASSDRGPMNHLELIDKYALPELPLMPEHRLILININKLEDRSDRRGIYNLVRYCWRLSKARAETADYVLAVVRGIVVGAFRPQQWMSATQENFPNIPYANGSESHRVGFRGEEAEKAIWDLYVGERGKRVTNPDLKHTQNPIRFWQC